jgi:hypothetical protein
LQPATSFPSGLQKGKDASLKIPRVTDALCLDAAAANMISDNLFLLGIHLSNTSPGSLLTETKSELSCSNLL